MKSYPNRQSNSTVEVQYISKNGIWVSVKRQEYFLSYKEHPWLKDAKVSEVFHLTLREGDALSWPDLDVELDLKSLGNSEKYALAFN
jgi:hypothetical protein